MLLYDLGIYLITSIIGAGKSAGSKKSLKKVKTIFMILCTTLCYFPENANVIYNFRLQLLVQLSTPGRCVSLKMVSKFRKA